MIPSIVLFYLSFCNCIKQGPLLGTATHIMIALYGRLGFFFFLFLFVFWARDKTGKQAKDQFAFGTKLDFGGEQGIIMD